MPTVTIDSHLDAITDDHKHPERKFNNEIWRFDHLQAFAMRESVELSGGVNIDIDVVVLFSNHCYTREVKPDEEADGEHIVMDGKNSRLMDAERYQLSLKHLPKMITELRQRKIKSSRENYVTVEIHPSEAGGASRNYVVFFDVKKDVKRRRRALLRVKSAYVLERPLTKREREEKPIGFSVLLKRAMEAPQRQTATRG